MDGFCLQRRPPQWRNDPRCRHYATGLQSKAGRRPPTQKPPNYCPVCWSLTFPIQAGFALVEVGSVSMKNTKNILTKNLLDACIGCVSFWLLGYGFAFGDNDKPINKFIGRILYDMVIQGKIQTEFPCAKNTISRCKKFRCFHAEWWYNGGWGQWATLPG